MVGFDIDSEVSIRKSWVGFGLAKLATSSLPHAAHSCYKCIQIVGGLGLYLPDGKYFRCIGGLSPTIYGSVGPLEPHFLGLGAKCLTDCRRGNEPLESQFPKL